LATILDTDVAIELRDGDDWVVSQIAELPTPLLISAITRVELENGVWSTPDDAENRRKRLDRILQTIVTLDFGAAEIAQYRRIIHVAGYSRRKTSDRMTAATALAQRMSLVTLNGRDFRDVPDLKLIAWERPA
jgi:tRNA(fMet)-specific endonuclease VapC